MQRPNLACVCVCVCMPACMRACVCAGVSFGTISVYVHMHMPV